MPSNRRFTNNASTTLAASITDSALSFDVTDGSVFPSLSGDEYFHATIDNQTGTVEVVKCTARSGNTLTVTRGQDGTSGTAFNSGTVIELRMIADDIDKKAPLDEDILPETTSTYDLGSATYKFADLHLSGNINIDGNIDALSVNVNGLTADASPDGAADYILTYDASAGTNKKVLLNNLPGGGGDVVDDTTPQLGGDLDVNGNEITSPDGTDTIRIINDQISFKTANAVRVDIQDTGFRLGEANARVTTILDQDTMASNSATALATQQSIKAYVDNNTIGDLADDATPQLGGNLDVNGNKITSTANGNIDIEPNGTGNVLLGNYTFDADQTVGAGQDDYVLTYDNGTGLISLEAAAGGTAATQADQETATSTTTFVSPGRQQYHPSAAKAWIRWDNSGGTPTDLASYNVSSLTDNGVGDTTINFSTNFSGAEYAAAACVLRDVSINGLTHLHESNSAAPTSSAFRAFRTENAVATDNDGQGLIFFGDQ